VRVGARLQPAAGAVRLHLGRKLALKKSHLVLIAFIAFFVLAAPVTTQAQSCGGLSCDWVWNGGFGNLSPWGWTDSNVSFPQISDTCLSGSPSTYVAELSNGDWLYQQMPINQGAVSWSLQFVLRINNDSNNWSDYLLVTVWNLDNNQYETFYLYTAQYDTSCNRVVLDLSNSYDYADVHLEFEAVSSSPTFQLDRVSFFARQF
jgi:hypothetical protein